MSNNTQKILTALLRPSVKLEAAQQQLATMRTIDNATGFTLTLIGKLVGQAREGVTDDELFRRYVRARVATNNSDTVGEDILTIARLVVTETGITFVADNQGAAAFVLRLEDAALSWDVIKILIRMIRKATGLAIRPIVEWRPTLPGFAFAPFGAEPEAGEGFESFAGGDGGELASAIE